jgi:dihydroxyacetone kinase-like predicted kinase
MLAWDGESADAERVGTLMLEAASSVSTGEVTTAVKDARGKVGKIAAGDVIGIVDDEEIEVVGEDVADVTDRLADVLLAKGAETLTLLAGEGSDAEETERIVAAIQQRHPEVSVEWHDGGQPLYPFVMSAE